MKCFIFVVIVSIVGVVLAAEDTCPQNTNLPVVPDGNATEIVQYVKHGLTCVADIWTNKGIVLIQKAFGDVKQIFTEAGQHCKSCSLGDDTKAIMHPAIKQVVDEAKQSLDIKQHLVDAALRKLRNRDTSDSCELDVVTAMSRARRLTRKYYVNVYEIIAGNSPRIVEAITDAACEVSSLLKTNCHKSKKDSTILDKINEILNNAINLALQAANDSVKSSAVYYDKIDKAIDLVLAVIPEPKPVAEDAPEQNESPED